jgi:hypothetical protein
MRRNGRSRVGHPVVLACGILLAAFALLQLVPYGHDHSTPPTTKRASLGPAAAQIADGACMDCHSNETTWPWYADVAPPSFLVVNDVKGGREHMNLSRWDTPQPDLAEVVDAIDAGGMPPAQYKVIHGGARLSDSERRTLIAGFRALYAKDPPPPGGGG